MGELAILHSKEMVATAEVSIKYKKPIRKDQFYVFEAEVIKREGRKIFIEGFIKDL
jgi:acyl-coenzyme A thioesterase PaaI-like protein